MIQFSSAGMDHLPRFSKLDFDRFRALIKEHCGIRIPDTKKTLLKGRIGRRLKALGYNSYAKYYEFVASDKMGPEELGNLWSVVTTHQTYFFREPHHFDALAKYVIPQIIEEKRPTQLHVWCAGCSSGEEAYTLASVILDKLGHISPKTKLTITATDIDEEMIKKAEAAVYPRESKKYIPPFFINRFFDITASTVVPMDTLKRVIKFRQHNLHDLQGVFGSYDIIFCRNVVMYFEPEFRDELMHHFHKRTKKNGYLFLGSSESVHSMRHLFLPNKYDKALIYQKQRLQRTS